MLVLRQPMLYEINDVHCSAFHRLTALQFGDTTCYFDRCSILGSADQFTFGNLLLNHDLLGR